LIDAIESGKINPRMDQKTRAKELQNNYGWKQTESRRVWNFVPDSEVSHLLIDTTKSAEYLQDIHENFVSAFQWAAKQGFISEKSLRDVWFNVCEVFLQVDPSHRKAGQIDSTGRRVIYASEYTAGPTLVKPVYLAEITDPLTIFWWCSWCFIQEKRTCFWSAIKRRNTFDGL
jgi:elongation factor 2